MPIKRDYVFTGNDGKEYIVEIDVYETEDLIMFPDGVSATFRLFDLDDDGKKRLVYLIDNHAPFDFHEHDKLPENHDSRTLLHVKDWKEAWNLFQKKYKERK